MDTRELKGMEIAATTRLRRTAEAWIVPSQSVAGTVLPSRSDRLGGRVREGRPP